MGIKKIKRLILCLASVGILTGVIKQVSAEELLEQEDIVASSSEIIDTEQDSSESVESPILKGKIEVRQSEVESSTTELENSRKDKVDHEKHQNGIKEFAKSLIHEHFINKEGSKELVLGGLEPFMQSSLQDKRIVFTPQTQAQTFRLPVRLGYDLSQLQTDLPKNKWGDAGRFTIHPSTGNMSIVIVGDKNVYPENEKLVVAIDEDSLASSPLSTFNLIVNGQPVGPASDYFDLSVAPVQEDATQADFTLTIKKEGLKLKGEQLGLSFQLPAYTRFDATYSSYPFSITKDNSVDNVRLTIPLQIDAEEPIVEIDNSTLNHIVDLKTPGSDRTSSVASGVSNLTVKNAQTAGYQLVVKRSEQVTAATFMADKLFYRDQLLTTESLQKIYQTGMGQSEVVLPLHELLQFRELSNEDLVMIYDGKNSVALDWIIQSNTDSLTSAESL